MLNVRFTHDIQTRSERGDPIIIWIDLWHRNSDLAWVRNEVTPLHGDLETLKVFLYKLKSSEYPGLQ